MSQNNDLIRRSDLKAAVDDICYSWGAETEVEGSVLIDLVEKLPAVDADVVRHGEWLPPVVGAYGCLCSECNKQADNDYDYCPNCGAKMDGDVNAD